jgi:hypothetical protein
LKRTTPSIAEKQHSALYQMTLFKAKTPTTLLDQGIAFYDVRLTTISTRLYGHVSIIEEQTISQQGVLRPRITRQ